MKAMTCEALSSRLVLFELSVTALVGAPVVGPAAQSQVSPSRHGDKCCDDLELLTYP
jgi:hypothetical protein